VLNDGSLTVRNGGNGGVGLDDEVDRDVDVDVEELGVLEEMETYVQDADTWWRGVDIDVVIESGGAPERDAGGEEEVV